MVKIYYGHRSFSLLPSGKGSVASQIYMEISDEYKSKLFKQNYSPQKTIEGVKVFELKQFSDSGGDFIELARFEQGIAETIPKFEIKQINYSYIVPGAIKGMHLHLNQDDLWFVPPSCRLLAGLIDLRKDSSTFDVKQRIILGANKPRLLYIPRGIGHGCANLSEKSVMILYFVNQHFSSDHEKCDEHRLPPDVFGKGFWKIEKN